MSQYDKYGRYFLSWFRRENPKLHLSYKFNSFWLALEMLDIFLLVTACVLSRQDGNLKLHNCKTL